MTGRSSGVCVERFQMAVAALFTVYAWLICLAPRHPVAPLVVALAAMTSLRFESRSAVCLPVGR
ncbi:hypothetical protein [Cohnella sp.]|uniref:hypothetical protein n=1 Tax=Cohnella sp. TaxID=1883426 RepID=UPI0035685DE6